jgi:hypothetical protein
VPTVVFEELIIIVTYLLACNLVVQHVVSCNWVLPVGNIFIIIIIIIIIIMEDADVAPTTVAANFTFKGYGAEKASRHKI